MFNHIFGRKADTPFKFTEEEFWTISETVDFLLMMNLHKITPESFPDVRNDYERKLEDAVENDEISYVPLKRKKNIARDNYFIEQFTKRLLDGESLTVDEKTALKTACHVVTRKMKCLEKLTVYEFIACKNLIDDCPLKQTGLKIHASKIGNPKIKIEKPANASLTAKERGGMKGYKMRDFIENIIKPYGLKELEAGCLCLHGQVVARIKNRVLTDVDKKLLGNDHRKFKENPDKYINKAVTQLFYFLDDKFDNVRARVFRGEYYDEEYCKRQPPPQLCQLKGHKK